MANPARHLQRLTNPLKTLIGRLGLGLLLSLACLAIFGAIAEDLLDKDPMHFDQWLATTLHAAASPPVTTAFLLITLAGSEGVVLVGVVVALILARRRRWLDLLIWAIALVGGHVLNVALKTLFARERPVFETPLVNAQFYSFPSGHAMLSIIAYGLLAYFIVSGVQSRRERVIPAALATILILLVGFSRLYLGAHFLTDVVGGYTAGWVWLATCLWALRFGRSRIGQRLDSAPPVGRPNQDI